VSSVSLAVGLFSSRWLLDDPSAAKDHLRQAGYDDPSVNAFARRLAEVRRSPMRRSTRAERVRELLGMRRAGRREDVVRDG
jgi:hypothetical protein